MDVFGSFALVLAFLCGCYAIVIGIAAIVTRHPLLIKSARQAGLAVCLLISIGTFVLVYLFLTDNFSMAYVVGHSNRDLPTFYKVAALWSGQEGSLLFWSWILSLYAFFVIFLNRRKHPELMPYVGVVIACVQVFFLVLNVFVASPYQVLASPAANGALQITAQLDGRGLNPLLQYPEMVIHPPMLYLGYVGFTIPFAFALAALLGRYPGEKWIHITRRWTMIAWLFQTVGVLLGAHWAYAVLGWGGYWGWDPVENASILPWLTGTAFLHSVMMQEKRGMMKVWNIWLVFITFLLCILGTFLTRSGIVSSVHAFAQSQSWIGESFVGFLLLALGVCIWAFVKNRDYLRSDNRLDSLVSRESSFLFNNLLLLCACFAVLLGTLFPTISELVGARKSVGQDYFNLVGVPAGLFLMFLTGIGPLLAWRRTSSDSLKRNFAWPMLGGIVIGAIAWLLLGGPSFWGVAGPYGLGDLFALLSLTLSMSVALIIGAEFVRGARVIRARSGENILSAMGTLTMRNTRRYGGYIIHFGMVLIFIGLAGAAFNLDIQKSMSPGDTMTIGPYTLVAQTFTERPAPNYTAERATLDVLRDGRSVMFLYPERRFYPANDMTGTMVAIYSTARHDLYVVYAGRSPENNLPVIHAYLNPLVKWIWFGGVIVVLGTGLALLPNRQPVLAFQRADAAARAATAPPSPQPVSVSLRTRSDHSDD